MNYSVNQNLKPKFVLRMFVIMRQCWSFLSLSKRSEATEKYIFYVVITTDFVHDLAKQTFIYVFYMQIYS